MVQDLSLSIIISVLFTRRLLLLNLETFKNEMIYGPSSLKSMSEVVENMPHFIVLNKTTLLACITLGTNQFTILAAGIFRFSSMWSSLNTMVNCWCIMLMFSCHNNVFERICGGCKGMVNTECLNCYSCNWLCRIMVPDNVSDTEMAGLGAKSVVNKSSDKILL